MATLVKNMLGGLAGSIILLIYIGIFNFPFFALGSVKATLKEIAASK